MKTIDLEKANELVKKGTLLSEEEKKAVQRERLHELVDYVRENSPYLKELYKDIPKDYELSDLPVIEKGEMLKHYEEYVTDPELKLSLVRDYLARDASDSSLLLGKYTALQTSGSTGEPLPMVRDDNHNKIHGALLTHRLFHGVEPELFDHSKHKTAFIVHISNSASSYGTYLRTKRRAPGYEDNITAIPITDSLSAMVKKLNDFQPEAIIAYPPSLVMLAEEKEKGNLNIPLKLIASSAELLTEENYNRIHEVFKCPILNNYCMTEGGEIAMTYGCPHLHINDDFIIIEPVDKDRNVITDGETFSDGILVTDLTNYVQPIIRYFVGDSVRIRKELKKCCPRPIMEIQGRVWDSFTLSGETFTTKALEVKAKFQKGLIAWQFLKTDDSTLEVRGVASADAVLEDALKELSEKLKDYFEKSGLKGFSIAYSLEEPVRNERGGKTPLFKDMSRGER